MQKRGQFTILVVFALLAIAAIGFVLILRSQVLDAQTKSNTNEKVSDFIESAAVRSYVDSCLRAVGEYALILGGSQGGYFWESQFAESSDDQRESLAVDYSGQAFELSYIVRPLTESPQCSLGAYPDEPDYPYPYTAIGDLDNDLFRDDIVGICNYYQDRNAGFFGIRTMTPLCHVNGPNWDTGEPSNPEFFRICEKYGYHSNDAQQYVLQGQIMNYSSARLSVCTNFEKLGDMQGTDIEFDQPNVSIIFGKENLLINATFPIREIGKRETSYATFEYSMPSRYKELYEFLWDLALIEVQNATFDASADNHISRFYREGFGVRWISCPGDSCPSIDVNQHDDILTVYDENSFADGEELQISGAIVNRRPVLDLMDDLVIPTGTTINRQITAIDPDGDVLERSWSIYRGSTPLIEGIVAPTINYQFTDDGTYTIIVEVSDGEYKDYQEVTVEVNSPE